jgi:26S proteasome regulatory subunit T6
VRLLREELQLLHEPGSYVGEVVKVMGKNKVLVKVQPEGKYSTFHDILYSIRGGISHRLFRPFLLMLMPEQSSTSRLISIFLL